MCLFLPAPHEDEANNHEEPNDEDNDPYDFYLLMVIIIGFICQAELHDETEIGIVVLCGDHNILLLDDCRISILDDELKLFVEL